MDRRREVWKKLIKMSGHTGESEAALYHTSLQYHLLSKWLHFGSLSGKAAASGSCLALPCYVGVHETAHVRFRVGLSVHV